MTKPSKSQVTVNINGARVFVTGGAGFIGSHLVRALLARGAAHVTVIDSLRYGDLANLASHDKVSVIQHTLGHDSSEKLQSLINGHDLLFHLAAEKHNQSKDSPYDVIRANIDGSLQVFNAAAQAGVKKIVYTSSLYANGRVAGADLKESDLPNPKTVYGMTKLAGEHLLSFIGAQFGVPFSVIRYMFVYGPKQFAGMGYKSVIVKNFERIFSGQAPIIFGDGQQTLDYIYVDDAVEATIRSMEIDTGGEVINVGSGEGISVESLIKSMCRVTGTPFKPLFDPADWTAGTRRVGDISRARKLLSWGPTVDFESGLEKTARWIDETRSEKALVSSSECRPA
jgi:UDP-glucose 4-epimerase